MAVVPSSLTHWEDPLFDYADYLDDAYHVNMGTVDMEVAITTSLQNLFMAFLSGLRYEITPELSKHFAKHIYRHGRMIDFIETVLSKVCKGVIRLNRHKIKDLIVDKTKKEFKEIMLDNFITDDTFEIWEKFLGTKETLAKDETLSFLNVYYHFRYPEKMTKLLVWGPYLWYTRHAIAKAIPLTDPQTRELYIWFLRNGYLLCNCVNCVMHVFYHPQSKKKGH